MSKREFKRELKKLQDTHLTEWFKLNKRELDYLKKNRKNEYNPPAHKLHYHDIPKYYKWEKKTWVRYSNQKRHDKVGRMHSAQPTQGTKHTPLFVYGPHVRTRCRMFDTKNARTCTQERGFIFVCCYKQQKEQPHSKIFCCMNERSARHTEKNVKNLEYCSMTENGILVWPRQPWQKMQGNYANYSPLFWSTVLQVILWLCGISIRTPYVMIEDLAQTEPKKKNSIFFISQSRISKLKGKCFAFFLVSVCTMYGNKKLA